MSMLRLPTVAPARFPDQAATDRPGERLCASYSGGCPARHPTFGPCMVVGPHEVTDVGGLVHAMNYGFHRVVAPDSSEVARWETAFAFSPSLSSRSMPSRVLSKPLPY